MEIRIDPNDPKVRAAVTTAIDAHHPEKYENYRGTGQSCRCGFIGNQEQYADHRAEEILTALATMDAP